MPGTLGYARYQVPDTCVNLLLNSPPRKGQGSDVSLPTAMALCIATSAIREIISLLIFCSLQSADKDTKKSRSETTTPWDLTFVFTNASHHRLGRHRLQDHRPKRRQCMTRG